MEDADGSPPPTSSRPHMKQHRGRQRFTAGTNFRPISVFQYRIFKTATYFVSRFASFLTTSDSKHCSHVEKIISRIRKVRLVTLSATRFGFPIQLQIHSLYETKIIYQYYHEQKERLLSAKQNCGWQLWICSRGEGGWEVMIGQTPRDAQVTQA